MNLSGKKIGHLVLLLMLLSAIIVLLTGCSSKQKYIIEPFTSKRRSVNVYRDHYDRDSFQFIDEGVEVELWNDEAPDGKCGLSCDKRVRVLIKEGEYKDHVGWVEYNLNLAILPILIFDIAIFTHG